MILVFQKLIEALPKIDGACLLSGLYCWTDYLPELVNSRVVNSVFDRHTLSESRGLFNPND